MGSPAIPDKNGKYPEQTSVRRYCDGLPKDSLAQGKTYAVCLTSEWKLSGLPECRFAGNFLCDLYLLVNNSTLNSCEASVPKKIRLQV